MLVPSPPDPCSPCDSTPLYTPSLLPALPLFRRFACSSTCLPPPGKQGWCCCLAPFAPHLRLATAHPCPTPPSPCIPPPSGASLPDRPAFRFQTSKGGAGAQPRRPPFAPDAGRAAAGGGWERLGSKQAAGGRLVVAWWGRLCGSGVVSHNRLRCSHARRQWTGCWVRSVSTL